MKNVLLLYGGGTPLKSEKIFLSPQQVDGFPKNIDYIKEWGFK